MTEEIQESQADIFSKENTYSGGPRIAVQFLILQYRDLCHKRLLYYLDQHDNSGNKEAGLRKLKASLKILYVQLKTRLQKQKDYKEKNWFKMIEDDPEGALDLFNDYMEDSLQLTKIDTRQHVDMASISARNKAFLGY